jgi:UDP-glucose 4-epimerase
MRILVTGGAGFIGSHIVDAYLEQGHDVCIVDNLSTGRQQNINHRARFYNADIRDARKMEELFGHEKFDVVNHLAAQMDVRRSVADPVFDASVNVLGVLTLLECCIHAGVARMIFSSTGGAIYGEQDYFPADEAHPTRPISPYGVAKLTTENYLFYYRVVHGLQSVVLRYANVYGPRQNPEGEAGVVAIFVNKMLKGEQPVINGDGTQTRDYVYVGDVVNANVLALGMEGSGVFNVGTGIESDVNTLFRHLIRFTGSKCTEHHGEAKLGEQLRSVLSCDKIRESLGWKPAVHLEEGLRRTVEYFREEAGHGRT